MDSFYLELSSSPIKFDSVSSLTNVFFDESNKQIFAVRSGGTTGVVVKGPTNDSVISFCMDNTGIIRSIKFSPDNEILAVQRHEHSVEFIHFKDPQQPNRNRGDIFKYTTKSSTIHGFVWVSKRECAVISNSSVELFTINPEKKQIKSLKSLSIGIKWFAWYSEGNMALISTTDVNALYPVLVNQKVITKLPKLELGSNTAEIPERDVTLGQLYGSLAILLLQQTSNRLLEISIYLLNGPGLAPRKSHIIRLQSIGRFAINIIDNLVIVHHQTSQTSMLFDLSLSKEVVNEITYHNAIIPGRSIKPFTLKLPSLSLEEKSVNCDLYSKNWVLFQPNIVIDAQLGCMWYLDLKLEPLMTLIADKVRLSEFLLQRSLGKPILLRVLRNLISEPFNGSLLTCFESIFDRINSIYSSWIQYQVHSQIAQPMNLKMTQKPVCSPPKAKVIITQNEMCLQVFQHLEEKPFTEDILMVYLQSLSKYKIPAEDEISKMIIKELIRNENYKTLLLLVEFSLICETKSMACFLLSYSKLSPIINQTALDMLRKISANEIILEVLLEHGQVIDALRIAKSLPNSDSISARKYLEAAQKSGDANIFYNVFKYFQQRNLKQRGKVDFLKQEQCNEFVEYYDKLFVETSS